MKTKRKLSGIIIGIKVWVVFCTFLLGYKELLLLSDWDLLPLESSRSPCNGNLIKSGMLQLLDEFSCTGVVGYAVYSLQRKIPSKRYDEV